MAEEIKDVLFQDTAVTDFGITNLATENRRARIFWLTETLSMHLSRIGRRTLIAMAIVVAIAILMAAFRSIIIPTPYGYLEQNRWTGRMVACHVEPPHSYISSALAANNSRAIDPPRYCVDLKSQDFEISEQATRAPVHLVPMPNGFDPFADKKNP